MATSQTLLASIFRSTLDPLVVIDGLGTIHLVSDSVERVLGWRRDEIVGRNIAILMPEPHSSQHDSHLQRYRETGRTSILNTPRELEAVRKDGSRFPCEITVWRVDVPGNPVPLFTGIIRDITERRTVQRELELARETAERACRAKAQFLANMSHEIRTPLTAILGFADLLILDEDVRRLPVPRLDDLRTIKNEGEHLLHVINDILDQSKIEAGQLGIERIRCAPAALVADVEAIMRPRALARGLAFAVTYEGSIPAFVETDPTRVRQILINLVDNAIKFTRSGSVTLRIRRLVSGQTSLLEFRVADTGIGMTAEQLKQIFQPFAQADVSMARRFGGTGLGLSISRSLAIMLGGELTAESDAGRGSTFTATIATGACGTNAIPISATIDCGERRPPAESPVQPVLEGCRVLVVEDCPANQRLLVHLLRKVGAVVSVAEDGVAGCTAALQALDEDAPFDVILLDMQMPLLDGYETAAQLRAAGYVRPIVALTAHGSSGDRDKCLAAGCDGYLTKPINRETLIATVQTFAASVTETAGLAT